jgi:succinyl-CoA synthetase beta subunit
LRDFHAKSVALALGLDEFEKEVRAIISGLYRLFWEKDASLVEINPLVITGSGNLVALDAKMAFDDNALFRHPEIAALRDSDEEDPREVEASKYFLNYIPLDGDIACMVNGAGLAMSTMDIIKYFGGSPANFLDVGGGASEEQVTKAFGIILGNRNIRGILVNIFGGIMHCDIIARGIIAAARNIEVTVPLVVRLEGTNVDEGRGLLAESDLKIETAETLSEAAKKIVSLATLPFHSHPYSQ